MCKEGLHLLKVATIFQLEELIHLTTSGYLHDITSSGKPTTKKALARLYYIKIWLNHAAPPTQLQDLHRIYPSSAGIRHNWLVPSVLTLINKLETVQRMAISFIPSWYGRLDSAANVMIKQSGLATLNKRAELRHLKFVFTLSNNDFRMNWWNYISFYTGRHARFKHCKSLNECRFNNGSFRY